MRFLLVFSLVCIGSWTNSCAKKGTQSPSAIHTPQPVSATISSSRMNPLDTVTFGAGCFWCVEAIFQRVKGVQSVRSGYTGGQVKNPTYRDVCTGTTGHAEVCQVVYDSKQVTFAELLEIFWKTHDPTTLNRQGADAGTQYRSAIFYHTDAQKEEAEAYKKELNDANAFGKPIVTEITPISAFYGAEDYHQNYFNENGSQPYCNLVIQPKLDKFEKVFKDKMKK